MDESLSFVPYYLLVLEFCPQLARELRTVKILSIFLKKANRHPKQKKIAFCHLSRLVACNTDLASYIPALFCPVLTDKGVYSHCILFVHIYYSKLCQQCSPFALSASHAFIASFVHHSSFLSIHVLLHVAQWTLKPSLPLFL